MNQVTISEKRYEQLKSAETELKDLKRFQKLKTRLEEVEKKHFSKLKKEQKGERS